jgi:tetratricopeptide (TPR) repeat protein
LADDRQALVRHFDPAYFWFNFRLYFLAPLQWLRSCPFVADIPVTAMPRGHGPAYENPLGLLVSVPFVWLALAAPLAWRGREPGEARRLRCLAAAAVWSFLTAMVVIALFYTTANRYEVEFAPALVLLAAIGLLGLERWTAGRPAGQRLAVRIVWIALLIFSVAVNGLAAAARAAFECYSIGSVALEKGLPAQAVPKLEAALRIKPSYAEAHAELGVALSLLGRPGDALAHLTEAVRLAPASAGPRLNLSIALAAQNRPAEALEQLQRAVQLDPDNALAHYNLGLLLENSGRTPEAVEQLSAAVRLRPADPAMREALVSALLSTNRLPEAVAQLRELLRLRPDDAAVQSALQEAEAALRGRSGSTP